MALIKGRLGAIYIAQYGAGATAMTNEATTANLAKTVFTIDAAAKRFVDPDTAIVIDYPDNATPVTSYATFQKPGGVVTWASTPGTGSVFITGAYLAIAQVGECQSWTLDISNDFVDTTSFGDTAREMTPMMRSATATIQGMYVDSTLFTEMVSTNPRIGFDLFLDATGAAEVRYTGYAVLASTNISADVGGIVEQPLSLNITDGPYYVAGLA